MRFLVKAVLPVDAGNALVRDPNAGQRIQSILEDVRPEATYFAIADGQRSVITIVNVEGWADLPRIAEPLWLSLSADVEFIPVATPEEFGQGMPAIEQAAKKFR